MGTPRVSRLAFLMLGLLSALPPRASGDVTLAKLAPVPLNGIEVRPASGAPAYVSFRKHDACRRLLVFRSRPVGAGSGVRSLTLRYRLEFAGGAVARPVALILDADGESWVKLADPVTSSPDARTASLSLAKLRPTEFSPKRSGVIEWPSVRALWVGFALDGAARGTLRVESAALADTAAHPAAPLPLTAEGAGAWTVHHDPAVRMTSGKANEGPGGKPSFRVEFTFAGGRHLFCNSSLPLPAADLEGYRALKMCYRATLPPGIGGLLVLLSEDSGACYRADPMPPASAGWTTLEIPLARMKLAEWTKDSDGRLDLGQVTAVWVGAHGTAAGDGGPGRIEVCDLQLVP